VIFSGSVAKPCFAFVPTGSCYGRWLAPNHRCSMLHIYLSWVYLVTCWEISELFYYIQDEVHERDKLSDFLLTVLKFVLAEFPGLKVILMSASLNKEKFLKYFDNATIVEGWIFGLNYNDWLNFVKPWWFFSSRQNVPRDRVLPRRYSAIVST